MSLGLNAQTDGAIVPGPLSRPRLVGTGFALV